MKKATVLALLTFLNVTPVWAAKAGENPAAAQRPLAKAEVTAALGRLDQALRARDLDAYMSVIDPEAELHLVSPVAETRQDMTVSYPDYRGMMAASFADAQAYEVKRQSVSVTLLPDGRALATDLLLETIRMKDKTFKSITSERLMFARKGGKAKVVGLAAELISSSQKFTEN